MGQDGSQSPEKLLPERTIRSDGNLARENTMSNQSISFNNHNQPQPLPQPQQQTSWFGSMSPLCRISSPSTSASAADGIPLYPCLPMPYSCHHNNPNNSNTGGGGIMALTNFGLGGNNNRNQGNTPPPRKFNFSIRSPQVIPVNTGLNNNPIGTPSCPQTPPTQQCSRIYHYSRNLKWLIPIIIMIDSLILLITMYENDCPHTSLHPQRCVLKFLSRLSFEPLNENPLLGPSYKTLLSVGALNSNLVTKSGQGWRLLTAVWLHAGVFHLVANMLGLLSIGRRLEREFGWLRVAIIYIVAGFGGSLLSALFLQNQISVGASGAVMGLLGAAAAEILVNWSGGLGADNQNRSKSLAALLLTLTVNLSMGLMPHVDNFAHIGGLCAGALLGFILLMRPRSEAMNQPWIIGQGGLGSEIPVPITRGQKHTSIQNAARFVALGLLVFSYAMGMLALFKGYGWGARRTCKWCKYMSCIPSTLWQCHT